MRLLLATPWLHPLGGGLERYAATLAQRLAAQGHDVTLVGHAPEAADETQDGVRRVGVPPALRLSNTPLSLAMHRAVRRLLRERPHDAVNVHTPVPGTAEAAALAARRARVPCVVTYHAGRLEAPPGPLSLVAWALRNGPERALLSRAAGRIAVSPYVAENVFGSLPSEVVPPGVDAARFREVAPPVPGRVLFVGPVDRAYAWKGLATLLDAFELLGKDATLRIVGEGDLVERVRERGRRTGRVEVVPRVRDDELAREYSQASVVCLPSLTPAESFGMVLAEANACGRPVVGSRVGGIPSFVRDGDNGLLTEPGDARSLADALARVLADPALARAMGERGRARVLAEHDWDALAARTALALERACTRGAKGAAPSAARPRQRAS